MTTQDLYSSNLLEAINDTDRVSGYTHDFYNYPARFSPKFAREIIKNFTNPGDLVLDPFMGGGTTLTEAKLLGRNSVGFDISTLANFLSSVKADPPGTESLNRTEQWLNETLQKLNCHKSYPRPLDWIEAGYQRNLSNRFTWRIRKVIEQYIYCLENSKLKKKEKEFSRCLLLKTSQWALDSNKTIPSVENFKIKLMDNFKLMKQGAIDFLESVGNATVETINAPAKRVGYYKGRLGVAPKLVLTSPPYPGIHVLYHRWQIFGRKETPAPFWIANSLDGHGITHYAMGNRYQEGLKDYFKNIYKSFRAVSKVCDENSIVIQIVAFKEKSWQLPEYLRTMQKAGFQEIVDSDDRIWRTVPNRKWQAVINNQTSSSEEVVLFHKLIL
ncbi:DNA methyltransferase [Robiginitalea sp. IMCC43444]|uniref:DNA methyltransferase n=1 Tax=Robiginitalea sp. IMCC43444 TaxID=3459121 RepID=UPI004042E1E5